MDFIKPGITSTHVEANGHNGHRAADPDDALASELSLRREDLQHLRDGSDLLVEVIRERGYESVREGEEQKLVDRGYTEYQIRTPGILIPGYAPGATEPTHWTYRHDNPPDPSRRYEAPEGSSKRLDVPPRCQAGIGDPTLALWVSEGAKKGDAGASHGLCILSVDSVWGWRGRNAWGGVTALADWELIHLKERRVFLAFDSDVWKPDRRDLRQSIERLTGFLERKGAVVGWCKLPELGDE